MTDAPTPIGPSPTAAELRDGIARVRILMVAKRHELEAARTNFAGLAADRLLAGDVAPAPNDVARLESELEHLSSACRELERRHQMADAEAKNKRLTELEAQARELREEFSNHARLLLAISQEALRNYCLYTSRSAPAWHMLFSNSEHVVALGEMREPTVVTELLALRKEAYSLGFPHAISPDMPDLGMPNDADRDIARSLLNNS